MSLYYLVLLYAVVLAHPCSHNSSFDGLNEKQFAEGFLARFDKELDNAVENIKRENTQKNQESNDIDNYLEGIKRVVDKYLEQGLRLNLRCGDEDKTVTNLIFGEILEALKVISCCPISFAFFSLGKFFNIIAMQEKHYFLCPSMSTILLSSVAVAKEYM